MTEDVPYRINIDLAAEGNNENVVDFSFLRTMLIGNKDLKFKLIGDKIVIQSMVDSFCSLLGEAECIHKGITVEKTVSYVNELENRAVVLNVLVSFLPQLNEVDENMVECFDCLGTLSTPIIDFFSSRLSDLVPIMYS